MQAAKLVAAYKQTHGLPVLDKAQEARVLERGAALVDDPELKDAIAHIQGVCKSMDKRSFIFAADEAAAKKDFELGYESVTLGMDATVLTKAFMAHKKELLG